MALRRHSQRAGSLVDFNTICFKKVGVLDGSGVRLIEVSCELLRVISRVFPQHTISTKSFFPLVVVDGSGSVEFRGSKVMNDAVAKASPKEVDGRVLGEAREATRVASVDLNGNRLC
jgi:hypothetical protein